MNFVLSLFKGVFSFARSLTKRMYRNSAIIASGSIIFAVVAFSTAGFGAGGKNNVITAYAGTIQETSEEDEDEENVTVSPESRLAVASMVESTESSIEMPMAPLMSYIMGDVIERWTSTYCNETVVECEVEADVETDVKEVELINADYVETIISITEDDYNNLVRIVEAEATGLDIKAKILVANVVINRVFSKDFKDTVTGVIFEGDGEQFQPIRDGRFYSVVLTDTSYEAVDRALIGEDYSQGALFFATEYSAREGSWFATHLKRLFEYNGHVFFGYY